MSPSRRIVFQFLKVPTPFNRAGVSAEKILDWFGSCAK
jgi:hypothetical protein